MQVQKMDDHDDYLSLIKKVANFNKMRNFITGFSCIACLTCGITNYKAY